MKNHFSILLVVATMMLLIAGCDSKNANPLTENPYGTVRGSIQLNPAVLGSLSKTRVAIYRTMEDYFNRQPAAQAVADDHGAYVIASVPPGHYFVDAWQDNDGNGGITLGDFYAVHCDNKGHMCCCCEPGKEMCSCWMVDVVR
jgi:uncharacterized protein (DUF2141 family)